MWNEKPYHSLDYEWRNLFGEKVYKLALDGGMTCPNRDGTLGIDGCIFCSEGGSGDFAAPFMGTDRVHEQIEEAKKRVGKKIGESGKYVAYFQSYTNTYAEPEYLEALFLAALSHPDIVGLSIGTRPDCLSEEVIQVLKICRQQKPVWIELGLQTIHETTAKRIRRGYQLPCFEAALYRLCQAGLPVVVHVILGLPGETRKQMLETVDYLGRKKIEGIKLQLLHILKGTELAEEFKTNPFPIMTLEEYADLVVDCVSLLPPETVIHRISGDGPKALLAEPLWSGNKRLVLNTIAKRFRERRVMQGDGRKREDMI